MKKYISQNPGSISNYQWLKEHMKHCNLDINQIKSNELYKAGISKAISFTHDKDDALKLLAKLFIEYRGLSNYTHCILRPFDPSFQDIVYSAQNRLKLPDVKSLKDEMKQSVHKNSETKKQQKHVLHSLKQYYNKEISLKQLCKIAKDVPGAERLRTQAKQI